MDIDITPPSTHCEGKPAMQLDLPTSDQVMMEVDPDFTLRAAPISQLSDPNHLSSSTASAALRAHSNSPSHTSPNSRPLDSSSQALRPIPSPPVVLIASSDISAWPKFKLDQLFVEWLSRPDSKAWLTNLLDEAKSGKVSTSLTLDQDARTKTERSVSSGTRSPNSSQGTIGIVQQQAPSSPVSRLFSKHIPFGDSDSSPRSPTLAPTAAGSLYRQPPTTLVVGDLDLGKSGTASPLQSDHLASREDRPNASRTSRHAGSDAAEVRDMSKTQISSSPQRDSTTDDLRSLGSEQQPVPDSKALDKVADGIAGMSAMLEQRRSPSDDLVDMSVETDTPGLKDPVEKRTTSESEAMPKASLRVIATTGPESEGRVERDREDRLSSSQLGHAEKSSAAATPALSGDKGKPAELGRDTATTADDSREDVSRKMSAKLPVQGEQVSLQSDSVLPDIVPDNAAGGVHKLVSAAIPPAPPKPSKPEDATMMDATLRPFKRKMLPRFYFPCGREAEAREKKERETMKEFFKNLRTQKQVPGVNRTDVAELVVEVIGLPSYFASIVFNSIQETFGRSPVASNRKESQHTNGNTGSTPEENEAAMKDIPDREANNVSRTLMKENAKADEDYQNNEKTTDTTMGEVNTSDTQDQHVNGFHNVSHGQPNSSSDIIRDPAGVQEGSNPLSAGGNREFVTEEHFASYYNAKCAGCSKEARLFNALLEPGAKRRYLIPSDFKPLLRALLMCHQGLAFLQATPEFQQRYSETVIERIYFGCTRQHNGRLTLQDIRRSKLLDTLMVVDEEEDINRERKYFSYEHFYVLYCRFWELDANHDLQIDREDLMRYGSHSLTNRIVDRIFGGYARPLDTPENPGYMSYTDFIWFCLSEEDKTSDTAIDYWFRCVDMDGDGLITMYDMEFFYKEQLHRMECFGHEPVQIRDILCQLLDMINPNVQPPVIRRRDLKHCRLAGNFFNVLFNLNKFFAIEARDPLQIRQEHATPELTDWDRFAALEYLRLSAEEEGEEDESWEDVGDSTNPLMAGEAPF